MHRGRKRTPGTGLLCLPHPLPQYPLLTSPTFHHLAREKYLLGLVKITNQSDEEWVWN
jgi:hypothetical protein